MLSTLCATAVAPGVGNATLKAGFSPKGNVDGLIVLVFLS